jgi:hypothetical protein
VGVTRIGAFAALGLALAAGCGRSRSEVQSGTGGSGAAGGSDVGAGTGGTGTGGSGKGGKGGKGGSSGQGSGGTAGGIGEAGMAGLPEACVPVAPRAPMRKLTRFQLDRVLADMLGDTSRPGQRLEPFDTTDDLASDGDISPVWVARWHEVAHDIALEATRTNATLTATLGCDPEVEDEPACTDRLMNGVLPRLWRRPLTPDDADELDAVFAQGQALGGDFASGVRLVLEVALQSPELVYRSEVGEPLGVPDSDPRAGWLRPTPFEMASRLSFLLWGSVPDHTLMAEGAAGGLRTQDEVLAAATRMLEDPRANEVLRYFHLRVLGLLDRSIPAVDDAASPAFTADVASLMAGETAAFIDDVSSAGPGGFELLLTAPYTYLNEPLAAFYGIPNVAGAELRKVTLDSPPYSGILTQGSFLATHSDGASSNPSRRGQSVLNAFLCADAPSPPVLSPPEPRDPALTTREQFEVWGQSGPTCLACHSVLDPAGFALEHFDQTGRYRDMEAGKPINAAAEVTIGDEGHPVDGAADLGALLASSAEAQECYVRHWAALAYGATAEAPLDECSRATLVDAFTRTNGDIRALFLELTQTDAFLYLAPREP